MLRSIVAMLVLVTTRDEAMLCVHAAHVAHVARTEQHSYTIGTENTCIQGR